MGLIKINRNLLPQAAGISGRLTPQTQALAARQIVSDLTSNDRENAAITPIDAGKVLGFFPIPKKFTITIVNGDDEAQDICFLNNDIFTALPANVTATYSDGFSGKLLAQLMRSLDNGNGMLTYGFNVLGKDEDGVASDEVVNAMSMEGRYYNGRGASYTPVEIDFSGAERNTQFKNGLLTIKTMVKLNCVTQLKIHLGAGESAQFVFSTTPLVD